MGVMGSYGDRHDENRAGGWRPRYLVFLDFDGVVHPLIGAETFLPRCVDNVNEIVAALDAHIVLSTAWRGPDWSRYNSLFRGRVIGCTPVIHDLSLQHLRYQEIRTFLGEQGWKAVPWLALDDVPEMFPPGAPLYAVDGEIGLTLNDRDRVLERFGAGQGVPPDPNAGS